MNADIQERVFTRWAEFQEAMAGMEGFQRLPRRRVHLWRGQREMWPLASAWERYAGARLAATPKQERQAERLRLREIQAWMEGRFRKYLLGTGGLKPAELESLELCWAYGRHYGLITPLLDWSESPYLALFLGLADLYAYKAAGDPGGRIELMEDDQVILYRLNVDDDLCTPHPPSGHVRIVDLNVEDSRLVAQKGVFTWLESENHFSLESFLAENNKLDCLQCFTLRGRSILAKAAIDLREHGIDWRTVYPDLQGAALATNALLHEIIS